VIDVVSRFIVRVVTAGYRRRTWLSGVALVLTLVVASGYLLLGALRVNPTASTYRVTIHLPDSGGLLVDHDVAVRGDTVGRIAALRITAAGVDAIADIADDSKIPASSQVRVSGLSAAGEQYIDFQPTSDRGPYLSAGSVVDQRNTATPVPLSTVLADANGVLAQTDPNQLQLIRRELSMTAAGPGKLRDIIDGGTFLLSTLDSVLPQTVSLLKNTRIVLGTVSALNTGLAATSRNVGRTLTGVTEMDGGYRRLLERTPALLSSIDTLFSDNSETMVSLLGNLVSTSQLLYLRVPALNALFPNYRGSTLDAVGTAFHDHGLWSTLDIYPRYTCDYGTPRRVPSAADYPEPFLYTYCRDDDPEVLIRGAKNAPRPAGDDTAGPPPGADLGQTTDPTPKGRFTIPTPYGGPTLPIEPPH
jgi:phospholipid/cholesterol/gamma-HCH transport system substrate-binding protein